jgi:uncharacterized membrane protein YdbT with pleckstrin-like domain
MGFPESALTEDEVVALHAHPHWKMLVRPVLVVLAVAVGLAAAWFALPAGAAVAGWVLTALGLVAVAWLAVWPWLRWRTTHYVFTNERIILREGVLSRHGRDIPLNRINDVSFSHNLVERMVGCGTLKIESAGERGPLVLADIPAVERTQSVLYELVEADRRAHTFGDEDREAIVAEVRADDERR